MSERLREASSPRRSPPRRSRRGRSTGSACSGPRRTLQTGESLREGLREPGYVEGQNLIFERRWAEGQTIGSRARHRTGSPPSDLIVAVGHCPPPLAAQGRRRDPHRHGTVGDPAGRASLGAWLDRAETYRNQSLRAGARWKVTGAAEGSCSGGQTCRGPFQPASHFTFDPADGRGAARRVALPLIYAEAGTRRCRGAFARDLSRRAAHDPRSPPSRLRSATAPASPAGTCPRRSHYGRFSRGCGGGRADGVFGPYRSTLRRAPAISTTS